MTQKQFAVKLGGAKTDVVESAGAGIGTDAVRILVDDATVKTKDDILKAIDVVRQRIVEHKFPLA